MSQHASPEQDGEYQTLLARSLEELKQRTAAHDSLFQLGTAAWSADLDRGLLVFTSPRGIGATCTLQIIGTLNIQDGTWLWAWDNPSIDPKLQEHARAVKKYGEEHHLERLTARKFPCTETAAWEFTAIACKLNGAEGAYRGPAGNTLVFMTYGNVQLSK